MGDIKKIVLAGNATGFIRLNALRLRIWALAGKGGPA
jgi:hypothetical protein